ncbi:MAG: chromosome segregation protein SMC [Fimbriimonadaceae bacterium]|nr:chromosome segregation protein SMC [Fimbriimonadaceae bacterium]
MRLKRVRIFGFKTFADKTEFSLEGDMIALVGPNGCGKSNIVDAILWGLGEPNVRNLRAQTSQDVIFSGSTRRKPLGFAEVTLIFDNEDFSLGISAPEVSITRRLNRNGDSEYMINRKTCRLRDIFELLADSGLGKAGYSIVGQKEIDAALAASPEERRAWIDEAAGVQRYRARRLESLKRLDLAQDHLNRIDDILREIESQREPLREEAEKAKEYKRVLEELRELESGLLMVEVAAAVTEIADLEARAEKAIKNSHEEQTRSEHLEAQAKSVLHQLEKLEEELEALRHQRQEAHGALERAQAALEIAAHKLTSLDEFEQSLHDEGSAAENRMHEAAADLERLTAEEKAEVEALAKLKEELSGGDEDTKRLSQDLEKIEAEVLEAKRVENIKLRSAAEQAHAKQRRGQIRAEIKGIDESMPDLVEGIKEAEAQFNEFDGKRAEYEASLKATRDELKKQATSDDASSQQLRRLLADRAALEGRKRGIEATIETHEGLALGARAVLTLVEQGRLKGSYQPVAEAITVDPDLAVAVETALGASAHDLIVPDEHHAKRAIQLLKEYRLGRATFQPIPLMRANRVGPDIQNLLRDPGVVGLASDLVQCSNENRPVIDSLLGRIIITRDLDVSLRLAKTSGWSRLVTLEGEVVHSSGAVSGGNSSRQSSGLVQRQAELTKTIEDLEFLDKQIEGLQKRVRTTEASDEALRKDEIRLRDLLEALRPDLEEARTWLTSLRHEHQSAVKSKEKLLHELEGLTAEAPENLPVYDLPALEAQRDEALKLLAGKLADSAQAAERLKEAETRTQQATSRKHHAERRLAAAGDNETQREKRLASLDEDRAKAREQIEAHEKLREIAAKQGTELDAKIEAAGVQKRTMTEESVLLREKAAEAQKNVQALADLAHQAELQRAKADARRAGSLQRLLEEYGLTQEDALLQAPNLEVPEDAAVTVARLRRELRGMGEVNLGAIEAYERLTERFEELFVQREDVVLGKEEVEAGIRELDKLTRDRFADTFEAVKVAFSETFVKLFGGGEGELRLSHPDDMLQTGVEVDVTIPGKKRQRLELLSGGERSLSAVAFLFALLKVKPSPLVVLDEVDAPLDGRNVERYIGLLKEFSSSIQFMLITHNPVTIENADIWFGVTMQEPGVSTLVPVKAPHVPLVEAVVHEAFLQPGHSMN